MYEALSGRYMTSTGTIAEPGAALRIDRTELFELMADNMPLLQGIFSGLRAHERRIAARAAAHAAHPADGTRPPAGALSAHPGSRTSKQVSTPGVLVTRTRAAVAFDDRLRRSTGQARCRAASLRAVSAL